MKDPVADFARVRELLTEEAEPFASFPVDGRVLVGDGGTFQCHASAVFPAGTLDVFDVPDYIVAVLRDHEPVRWAIEGRIVSDTASGTILTSVAHEEVRAITDEFLMADLVDEADLPALLSTPNGVPLAVFSLLGDGELDVATGYDGEGQACAFLVYVE